MADDKTVSLRVDGSQGEDALKGIERAAEGAAEAMGKLDSEIRQAEGAAKGLGDAAKGAADKVGVLGAEVKKTEENTKRLAGTNREYESAARSVGNSVQAITRLEAAWRASILDTQNSEKVRAAALAVVFNRNIGGAADEARAMEMLAGNHKDAAAAIRFMNQHGAVVAPHMNNAALASRAFGSRLGNLSNVAQQAGYQISDIAAVAAAGGNVMSTAGTQLGQFMGAFGPWGAAAGAAVTVAGAVAAAMTKDADAAKKAEEAVKAYAAALDGATPIFERFKQAQDKAGGKAEHWREERDAVSALQQQLEELLLKREEMVKNTNFFRTNLSFAPSKDDFSEIDLKIANLRSALIQAQKTPVQTRAITASEAVLTSDDSLRDMQIKQRDIKAGIDQAKVGGNTAAVKNLTDAYNAVTRAVDTYVTEGQREVLMAEAKTKANSMNKTEAQHYLALRGAEIGLMGKVIEIGELERQQKATSIDANAAAAKSYAESQKTMSAAAIGTQANLAQNGLDMERQALAQRKALGEISAADELALAISIDDRKRAVAMQEAQRRLELLRRTAGTERTEIDAAERAITELRAKHSLERIKQVDAELAARQAAARQVAETGIKDNADKGKDGIAAREENLSFNKAMGNIGGAEEIAELRAIAEEKIRIRREELEATLQLAGLEQTERNRINKELVGLERQRALEMSKIDHQETRDRLAEIKGWTAPFNQAVNSTVTGFIQGTLTKKQAAAQAAQSIAASYISKFATIATDWFSKNVLMAAWDSMFGAKKIAQQATNTTQTSAIKDTGVAKDVSTVVAGAQGEAAGVAAGEAEKNAAQAAGATTGLLTKAGAAVKSIAISAYEAAAGAYAAIASIPYVGPFLAPVVAAGALAAVFAFGKSVASAEGGWGEVPEDGAQAVLHKKEMVLPARYAEPLRQMLTSSAPAQAISAVASGGGPLMAPAAASALSAIGNANVGRRAEAFAAPLSGGGLDHRAAIAALAAGNIGIPSAGRFALPDWLGKGPNFQAANNTTTNNSHRTERRVQVTQNFNISALDGASVKRVLMDNKGAVSEAMLKALANSDPNAMAFKSKK